MSVFVQNMRGTRTHYWRVVWVRYITACGGNAYYHSGLDHSVCLIFYFSFLLQGNKKE
jgi:hypothetical protein